jgi:hypothetical protein
MVTTPLGVFAGTVFLESAMPTRSLCGAPFVCHGGVPPTELVQHFVILARLRRPRLPVRRGVVENREVVEAAIHRALLKANDVRHRRPLVGRRRRDRRGCIRSGGVPLSKAPGTETSPNAAAVRRTARQCAPQGRPSIVSSPSEADVIGASLASSAPSGPHAQRTSGRETARQYARDGQSLADGLDSRATPAGASRRDFPSCTVID